MEEETKSGLRIFLQYWILFALLGGFNIYKYITRGSTFSLVVAIACVLVFVGWLAFYKIYVRRNK